MGNSIFNHQIVMAADFSTKAVDHEHSIAMYMSAELSNRTGLVFKRSMKWLFKTSKYSVYTIFNKIHKLYDKIHLG